MGYEKDKTDATVSPELQKKQDTVLKEQRKKNDEQRSGKVEKKYQELLTRMQKMQETLKEVDFKAITLSDVDSVRRKASKAIAELAGEKLFIEGANDPLESQYEFLKGFIGQCHSKEAELIERIKKTA